MERYLSAFARIVAEAVEAPEEEIAAAIKVPEADHGDLAFPCFPLAKRLRKSPVAIAAEVAAGLDFGPLFSSVEAAGPYLNATISPEHLLAHVLPEVRAAGDRFAHGDEGDGRAVVIDYSSPNIAKPLGFHHLRSTMIGNALSRIHEALGYRVVGINFLGDWGKTFGLLGAAFERWGDDGELAERRIGYLLDLYVRANKEAGDDPAFDDAAREMFRRQEAGDARALQLWAAFREHSIAEFDKIYRRLGVAGRFSYEGESTYRDGMDAVIDRVAERPGTREDQGALVVDMEYAEGEPPMLLRKRDGATLYATRDIAAAIHRHDRYEFARSLYVVGVEQRRHFDQLKRALAAMGHEWAERMVHVEFGRVQGMSTRKGQVVFLEEVLDEARDRAREKMLGDAADRDLDVDAVAEQVGVGGVVFGDLKNLRTSDYTFDWEEILNPKGFTGVCVQYAHARCCSVLRKGGGAPEQGDVDVSLLAAPEELTLVKELGRLPGAVRSAAAHFEPSRLARAAYEVARAWNRYQQAGNNDRSLRVLGVDEPLSRARLALVDATRIGLKSGLALLGVPTPEAM